MTDRDTVIKGLEWILEDDRFGFGINWETGEPRDDHEKAGKIIPDAISYLNQQFQQLAERPEIIRCKDCKRYYANGGACDQVLSEWFCADGKRK